MRKGRVGGCLWAGGGSTSLGPSPSLIHLKPRDEHLERQGNRQAREQMYTYCKVPVYPELCAVRAASPSSLNLIRFTI